MLTWLMEGAQMMVPELRLLLCQVDCSILRPLGHRPHPTIERFLPRMRTSANFFIVGIHCRVFWRYASRTSWNRWGLSEWALVKALSRT
mmetsp:Transcript_35897/g.85135  ORF Transcript_35897/g.85135 Transcript_35897/m.85135 type:complete len:89 (+) Transcript_35897:683-949(+)